MLYSFISYSLLVIEQTENGLVEAVAVLISKMPRMRPELEAGKLGECFKAKPDFMKVYFFFMVYILFKLFRHTCTLSIFSGYVTSYIFIS